MERDIIECLSQNNPKRGNLRVWRKYHCVKSVRSRTYSGPYFSAFGLNTERYRVSLRLQSKCGKLRTRITPNKDIFYAVYIFF